MSFKSAPTGMDADREQDQVFSAHKYEIWPSRSKQPIVQYYVTGSRCSTLPTMAAKLGCSEERLQAALAAPESLRALFEPSFMHQKTEVSRRGHNTRDAWLFMVKVLEGDEQPSSASWFRRMILMAKKLFSSVA
jgi:hypothetical protein